MSDSVKNVRGASYPVIDLKKSVESLDLLLAAIGKAAASKDDVARALNYSGVNGKSKRVIAALIQFGLINGRSSEHKLSDLSLRILFPEDEQAKRVAIRSAALKPGLFKALVDKYAGGTVPGLLSNILVTSHGINPTSGEEAAKVFRSSLEYAGLIDQEGKIVLDGTDFGQEAATDAPVAISESEASVPTTESSVSSAAELMNDTAQELNKIEIIIRNGVKAGIYAPAGLTAEEKQKLKTIIDLL